MPKYSKVDLGQIEALINKVGGEEGMRGILAGKLKVVPVSKKPAGQAKKRGTLVRDGSFSAVKLLRKFDPREFYRTRDGLLIWNDFKTEIVGVAGLVAAGVGFKQTNFWKLVKNTSGQGMIAERPEDVWTATDFCAWLSVKLTTQPNGEIGDLLNTGWANLFLVEGVNKAVFVVDVRWDSGDRRWDVNAWGLGCEWAASRRFFSKPPIAL
jgi:hypothetical protein